MFLVLALPLVAVVAIPAISSSATIWIYGAGLIADVVVALGLLALGVRYAARTARGDLFSIPLVSPIVDRWLRVERP